MQKIAAEMSGFVSEVGFVFPFDSNMHRPDKADLSLKYFSPEREVDFCGHATIAIMHDLFRTGYFGNRREVRISTNRGVLSVVNRIAEMDAVFISAPLPEFRDTVVPLEGTAAALGIRQNDIDSLLPVCVINAGLNTLLVPISSLDTVLAMKPDYEVLRSWCRSCGADIVEVFCSKTVSSSTLWRVRVFCPLMGYLEDPATGSGNSAFGYYLLKNALWDGLPIELEQNGEREAFNLVKLTCEGTAEEGKRVWFGGGARVKIDGFYHIE
jgi:PhzF family phenazine biosynthesis protein